MIIVLGASGYVGQGLVRELKRREIEYRPVSRELVDYYHSDRLTRLILDLKCDFLINAAGYTGRPNVDACELQRTECLYGNAILPGRVKTACERAGIPWGHISSGCIFSGSRPDGSGFRETDPPNFSFRTNNCSFYSGCKALGEEVLSDAVDCYIWRLRIPFDERDGSRNYLSKLLRYQRLLDARNSLSHLADFCAACVQSWTDHIPYGTYNLTNAGSVTTREVCERLKKKFPDKHFDFFRDEEEFMQIAAKTPRSNCVLDSSKALSAGLSLPPVEDAIARALCEWTPEHTA